jgi:mono/diheme cytochrome c family protein
MRLVHYFLRVVLLLLTAFCFSTDTRAADVESDSFAKVRQVFLKNCVSCHSQAGKIRGGLDLTSAEKVLAGGSSGGFDPVEAKPGDRSIRRDL